MASTARIINVALALAAASCQWILPYGSSPRRDVAMDEGAMCGGTVCKPGERCCGPPGCPRCVSIASSQPCPESCPVDATVEKRHACTLATGCESGRVCDVRSCALDATGVCQVRPEACDASITRVCGCDGKTYNNDCERLRQSAAWSHDGPCRDATVALDARLDLSPKGDLPKPKPDVAKPPKDLAKPQADSPTPCNGCYAGTSCVALAQQNENQCGYSGQTCQKCGPGLNCNVSTGTCVCRPGGLCPGCCSSKTSCVAIPTAGACGSGGGVCVTCPPTWACSGAGICLPPLCLACAGCCDKATSTCVSNTSWMCGRPGDFCVDCSVGGGATKCKNGSCVPSGCTCAGALCCDPVGSCVPGTSDGSCGSNGEACKLCPANALCILGQCVTGP